MIESRKIKLPIPSQLMTNIFMQFLKLPRTDLTKFTIHLFLIQICTKFHFISFFIIASSIHFSTHSYYKYWQYIHVYRIYIRTLHIWNWKFFSPTPPSQCSDTHTHTNIHYPKYCSYFCVLLLYIFIIILCCVNHISIIIYATPFMLVVVVKKYWYIFHMYIYLICARVYRRYRKM